MKNSHPLTITLTTEEAAFLTTAGRFAVELKLPAESRSPELKDIMISALDTMGPARVMPLLMRLSVPVAEYVKEHHDTLPEGGKSFLAENVQETIDELLTELGDDEPPNPHKRF